MTRDEPREKVAMMFCGGNEACEACRQDADAAIALVRAETLEEAAMVAEKSASGGYSWNDACHAVAAAIRAMGKADAPADVEMGR